jgi:hypothetical protein
VKPAAKIIADGNQVQYENFAQVCRTRRGIEALNFIFKQCRYAGSMTNVDPASGEINTNAVIHNTAQRAIWMSIRQYIPVEVLAEIEITRTMKPKPEAPHA